MNGKTAVIIPNSNRNVSFSQKCYIDPIVLSIFQRILLTNNGTITDLIEIYTSESIKVKKVSENIMTLNDKLQPMQLNEGAKVLERKILLRGGISGRNYVYAESIIALERLDEQMRESLLNTQKPIGKIWLENKVEIFKETLETGKIPAQELGHYFDIDPKENLLFRTYCVISHGNYTMMITEKFPENYFTRQF
ncbi:chorismate lyase [Nostoc sp. CENA67]|uniref:Chorismate lyase n=1 Tax=Amazonocrinis nigriterrae CENA67 TaxID=2794033 RepID=A0A8J7HUV4_9NOST|nr:chorismate lyase [Amazonocrinis nigriterrae]MBH8564645.1 chorismate lyase [Amazonocrinis nigriterrae CENA67]